MVVVEPPPDITARSSVLRVIKTPYKLGLTPDDTAQPLGSAILTGPL